MQEFDLLNSPLDGNNLIEAGAGTGKTFTISGIYLRLLLEKGLGVEDILVVTFTVAATEELRDRIRKRLSLALQYFNKIQTREPEDKLLSKLG
ncbi:MAG: UvrD-helicase domain-containing protein, partial [Thermodesulfobacteriota bacterium]